MNNNSNRLVIHLFGALFEGIGLDISTCRATQEPSRDWEQFIKSLRIELASENVTGLNTRKLRDPITVKARTKPPIIKVIKHSVNLYLSRYFHSSQPNRESRIKLVYGRIRPLY